MGKRTIVVTLFCLFGLISFSQHCIPGTIVFSTQAQVDSFPSNYPGCSIIDGNVGFYGNFDNLDSLIQVTKIGGSMQMLAIGNLNDLEGLNNLERIGNHFIIIRGNITNLNGLNSLKYIGGDFSVSRLPINTYQGLSGLDSIMGSLHLDQSAFANLNGLSNLDYVGSDIYLSRFTSLGNINNFDTIRGSLIFNYALVNDLAFPNLKVVKGNLIIGNGSGTFQNISGFNQLIKVHSNLEIDSNFLLYNITGFNQLSEINGSLTIKKNDSVTSLAGFNQLNYIGNNLEITDNYILSIVSGFNNIDTIANSLELNKLPFLELISGINQTCVIGKVNIQYCPFLFSCNIDPICNLAWLGSNLYLMKNGKGCSSILEVQESCPPLSDIDNDGIYDIQDNCQLIPNTNQADANNDGEGNVCDSNSDTDNDGSVDSLDNCVTTFNPNQADANNDGEGDKCDNNSDSDGDGKNDNLDNCPPIFNPDQRDCNNNGIGDVCEAFVDNDCDGIANTGDNCPEVYNPYQIDYNNNSIGDACENFPKVGFNTTQPKTEMHLSYSNLYLDHPEKGIIYKASNNQCYKSSIVIINNQPQIKYINIPCP